MINGSIDLEKFESLVKDAFDIPDPILGLKDDQNNYFDLAYVKEPVFKRFFDKIFKVVVQQKKKSKPLPLIHNLALFEKLYLLKQSSPTGVLHFKS